MGRMRIVLAVEENHADKLELRRLYPPCFRTVHTQPLPPKDPPRWVLPGGIKLTRAEAERIAWAKGWELEAPH